MAHMSQENKKRIAEQLKKVIPDGWKYSLSVNHHSTLVLTISEAPIDLVLEYHTRCREIERERNIFVEQSPPTYCSINPYWLQDHFKGERLDQMQKILAVLNDGNHDRSDIQSDYFDVGWYVDVRFGKWNKPFKVTGQDLKAKAS